MHLQPSRERSTELLFFSSKKNSLAMKESNIFCANDVCTISISKAAGFPFSQVAKKGEIAVCFFSSLLFSFLWTLSLPKGEGEVQRSSLILTFPSSLTDFASLPLSHTPFGLSLYCILVPTRAFTFYSSEFHGFFWIFLVFFVRGGTWGTPPRVLRKCTAGLALKVCQSLCCIVLFRNICLFLPCSYNGQQMKECRKKGLLCTTCL